MPKEKTSKIPYHLIIIFFLLSICIWIAGYLYYEHQREYIKKEKQDELSAIADLKIRQILNWRKERMADAEIIFNNPLIVPHIKQGLESGASGLKQEILTYVKSLQEHYQYKSVILLDTKGDIRLAVPGGKESLGPDAKRFTMEAIRTKKVFFSDLYKSKITNVIRLSLVIPLLISQGHDTIPVGVLLLRSDPYEFLYSLIQSWPTPSNTAETVLVRREGENVIFLNELRHRKDTALTLRFPITEKQLPEAMAARGIEGVTEGIDYRGVPVLAVMRAIPDSPWFLVAKIDKEEIYAPIRERFQLVTIIVILLIGTAGVSVGLFWRHQRAVFYRKQYETEYKHATELRQKEEILRSGEERFRIAAESASDLIWEWDIVKGKLVWFGNIDVILGYEKGEFPRTIDAWEKAIHPDDYDRVLATLQQHLNMRTPYIEEYRVIRKDGSFRYWTDRGVATWDEKGKAYRMVGSCSDITERKHAEEEIRTLNAELEQRVRDRTAQFEAANKELEAFSYSVSHDLRAPLRAIDGFTHAIIEDYADKFDEEGKRLLNIVSSNAQKMGQLIDDLLTFSRTGRQELRISKIEMDTLARTVFEELKAAAPERTIQFSIKPLPLAHGDQAMIRQVFVNLLSNAVKFTRPKETAIIEVGGWRGDENTPPVPPLEKGGEGGFEEIPPEQNIYYVRDNGVGFEMQYVNKLFSVFQRLHSESEFEGTGVGLAIVKRIIYRHGGRVWAEGKVNGGATFFFTLPKKDYTD
jgi:PAS domain S-box-containing protein